MKNDNVNSFILNAIALAVIAIMSVWQIVPAGI
ncbi:hypothetical protein IMSAG049_01308 [Clostridiales bacterium]|nr:hypothetical protein IMSAG049_01308 [Clostridiales bacterium]